MGAAPRGRGEEPRGPRAFQVRVRGRRSLVGSAGLARSGLRAWHRAGAQGAIIAALWFSEVARRRAV